MTGSDRLRMKKPLKNHEAHTWKKRGGKPFTDQTDGGGRGFTPTTIEGEGGTAYPSNTRGSALQPGCWPGAAWLLGFHSQDFVREAKPTTIGLIGKGFFPFFFHE